MTIKDFNYKLIFVIENNIFRNWDYTYVSSY